MLFFNVAILLFCLVAILFFKGFAADRTSVLLDFFAPPVEQDISPSEEPVETGLTTSGFVPTNEQEAVDRPEETE
jgi:hypothetical protein